MWGKLGVLGGLHAMGCILGGGGGGLKWGVVWELWISQIIVLEHLTGENFKG